MKSIKEVVKEIIEDFERLPDIDAKYAYLFQLGDHLPVMDGSLKTDDNLVSGCQSSLWFHLRQDSGRIYLIADSDSLVIKGIAALLVRLINGREADEIQTLSMDFIDQIKIWKLASNRNNGLMAMLKQIKKDAQEISLDKNDGEKDSQSS